MKSTIYSRFLWAFFILASLLLPLQGNAQSSACFDLLSARRAGRVSPFQGISKIEIIRILQALDPLMPIGAKAALKDRSDLGREMILQISGREGTLAQLFDYVSRSRVTTWSSLLDDAGLGRQVVRRSMKNVSLETAIRVVQALEAVRPINTDSAYVDVSPEGRRIIFEITGTDVPVANFYIYVTRHLKIKWSDLLTQAKLDHHNLTTPSPFRGMNADDLRPLLRELDQVVDIRQSAVREDVSPEGRAVILRTVGIDATVQQLYEYVRNRPGMIWTELLAGAGIQQTTVHQPNPFRGIFEPVLHELVRALDETGSINAKAMVKNFSPERSAVIYEVSGIRGTCDQLYYYVTQVRRESWSDFLFEAGLGSRVQGLVNPFAKSSRRDMVRVLQALGRLRSIDADTIAKDRSVEGTEVIREVLGIKATPAQLYFYVHGTLGERWKDWLVDVRIADRHRAFTNPFEGIARWRLLRAMHELDRSNFINARNIGEDRSAEGKKILRDTLGVDATASQLFYYVVRIRGENWTRWLREAQLGHRFGGGPRNPFYQLEPPQIVSLMQSLDRVILLNAGSIKSNTSEIARREIQRLTGIDATASQLYAYITRVKKESWTDWLEKAGLEHRVMGRENPFTELSQGEIVDVLRELDETLPISARVMQGDRSPQISQRLFELSGRYGSAAQFYYNVVHIQRLSWESVLRQAGFEHRIDRTIIQMSDTQLTDAIRALHEGGFPLNYNAVVNDTSRASAIHLKHQTGLHVTPAQLIYQIGRRENPDERVWDFWLSRAGLNPIDIRLRGTTPFYLLSSAMKGEVEARYQALARGGGAFESDKEGRGIHILVDDVTPEASLARSQFQEALSEVVADLTPRQAVIFDLMLTYFESRHYSEIDALGAFLSRRMDPAPSEDEWKAVLAQLAQNEELRTLMLDTF